jgi:RNA polymerase sigma factor (sigma-70 family)
MGAGIGPEMLAAARAGHGPAFENVFRALGPAVHGYVRAQGARDPEGAVNDVFLRVHRSLPGFDGDGDAFRSWVFVIAHNVVADERRRLHRRAREDTVADVPDRASPSATEDAVLADLGEARVRAVLAVLSPDQRDVLLLRFLADLPLERVAEATGRSVTAVKALQRRGLDALRRRLVPGGVAVSREAETALTGV